MNTSNLLKIVGVVIVVSGMAMSTAVAKNSGFVNKVGCYAAMKVKCSGGKCSADEYNESIDWCDETFQEEGSSEKLKTANGVLKLLFKQ